jgi:hypothetical protein
MARRERSTSASLPEIRLSITGGLVPIAHALNPVDQFCLAVLYRELPHSATELGQEFQPFGLERSFQIHQFSLRHWFLHFR